MSLPPPPPPPPPAGSTPFASPYTAPWRPASGVALDAPAQPRRALGMMAMCAGIVAALVPWICGAVAGFQIGLGAGAALALLPAEAQTDLSVLSPVRDWVLLAEVAFWAGTVLGIWALVQGIIAIARRRGRMQGVIAVVTAALGVLLFALATAVGLAAGAGAGSTLGG